MADSAIRVSEVDRVTVVSLIGEHDLSTSDRLAHTLQGQFPATSPLVIDLAAATFVDSCVIRELVAADKRSRRDHVALGVVISEPRGPVYRALEVAGLLPYLPIYPSVAVAVAAIHRGAGSTDPTL